MKKQTCLLDCTSWGAAGRGEPDVNGRLSFIKPTIHEAQHPGNPFSQVKSDNRNPVEKSNFLPETAENNCKLQPVGQRKTNPDPVHTMIIIDQAFTKSVKILDITLQVWVIPEGKTPA